MPDLIVSHALLPTGWAERVLFSFDSAGFFVRVEPGSTPSPSDESIGGIALPGVPNLHSHAFQRALAGLTERRGDDAEDSFWSWRETMYAFLARLEPDDVEAIAAQLYVEMLRAGYTGVAEFHYLHRTPKGTLYDDPAEMSRRLVAAAETAGIGLALLPAVYMTGDFGSAPPNEGQRRFLMDPPGVARLLEALRPTLAAPAAGGARRFGLALHSLRAVPPAALSDALALVRGMDPGAPVHIHAAEQRKEVDACVSWSGARPVEWLLEHAPVDERWCLIHATHVTGDEVRRLAAARAVAGLCPTTEANLGDGLFPLRDYLGAHGFFGVGSDSHVSVSPVEELRWLEYGQRLVSGARNVASGFPHASTGRSLFEGAVAGGARALGVHTGALEVGRRADLIVLDAEHPALAGRTGDALLDSWVFAGNRATVRDVLVGGRWVVRDGHHAREEPVLARYRETIRRLV
jgi:formimidoylglutamate deiminase